MIITLCEYISAVELTTANKQGLYMSDINRKNIGLRQKDAIIAPINRLDWKYIIQEVISSLLWFSQLGIRPTLRTMFYRLVSIEIIPNTEQSYKTLSSATVKARKKGEIPWDCFSDQGRQVLVGFKGQYTSPEEFIQAGNTRAQFLDGTNKSIMWRFG